MYIDVCVCVYDNTNRSYKSNQNQNEIACSFQQRAELAHTQRGSTHTHIDRYGRTVALETEHGGQTLTFLCVPQPISRQQQSAKKKKRAK